MRNFNKQIESIRYTTCTGCAACYNICPVDAINMKRDEKGYRQ